MDNVLVTGGAGFIGSHVAAYYDERGVEVTALDNLSRLKTLETANSERDTAGYNWRYLADSHSDVTRVNADVREYDRLESVVEGHDGIVHTAGQVAVTTSLSDSTLDFEVNARGTFNVLEAARNANSDPAVVYASTNKVYGDNVNDVPVREEDTRYWYDDPAYSGGIPESFPIDDCEHTPYGVSKLAGDLYVQDYARRGVLDAAAFRMSCIYGPRQFGTEDQGWVAHFLRAALADEEVTIFGDGKQVRDVLYVDDLVRAYDAFLRAPSERGGVYNMGGGPENTTSLLEFLDAVEAALGDRPTVEFDDWREGDQRVYVSDITRAREALDWEPEVDLENGIERYLDWHETLAGSK
jgi:CDP-paratose 2-epimerase